MCLSDINSTILFASKRQQTISTRRATTNNLVWVVSVFVAVQLLPVWVLTIYWVVKKNKNKKQNRHIKCEIDWMRRNTTSTTTTKIRINFSRSRKRVCHGKRKINATESKHSSRMEVKWRRSERKEKKNVEKTLVLQFGSICCDAVRI